MCLWCSWKDLDEQDLMEFIYLVRFGFKMWEILIFKWFLLLKIQINSKKPGFGREKLVEDVVTFGPKAQATLVNMKLKTIQTRDLCKYHHLGQLIILPIVLCPCQKLRSKMVTNKCRNRNYAQTMRSRNIPLRHVHVGVCSFGGRGLDFLV